jgi:uncharacterized protein
MDPIRIYAESASDDNSRALGLMHRKALAKNSGMLFVFPSSIKLSFWMKDTGIPLDIAYIRDDMTVSEIRSMAPYSTMSVRSSESVKYALEANSGFFERNGIVPGSRLVLCQDMPVDDVQSDTPSPEATPPSVPPANPPANPPAETAKPNPMPDLLLNMSVRDVVPLANKYKLAIAFDYEYPEGSIKSYYMLPLDPYDIIPGKSGELLVGRCSHSGGEFRDFHMDNITGYDLYETIGPRAGKRVSIPSPPPVGQQVSDISDLPIAASCRSGIVKESEYSVGQLMMTEYWDDISRKRKEGKTEGEAILEYLSENSSRNSPKKRKKEGAEKQDPA